MRHCVAGYALQAAAGRSFLFHRQGATPVTVEVQDGRVAQARSCCNQETPECDMARKEWDAWVRQGPWH